MKAFFRQQIKAPLARVGKTSWLDFIRFVIQRFTGQGCQQTAAALTYTTLFALVPLMTVVYSIMSALPSTEAVGAGIEEMLFKNLLPESSQAVSQYLSEFARQARSLTVVGVAILVVTAILMMKAIERAFNGIWSVSEDRKGASSFLLYWSVLTLGPLLMGSGIAVTSFVVSNRLFLDATDILGITRFLLALVPLMTSALAFMMLFRFVPKAQVAMKHALVGGLFTALCFEMAKWVFTQFVSQSPSYKVVYGAFAAVPLFLLWIYISWNLVLLGGTLVMALGNYRPGLQRLSQQPLMVALQVLAALVKYWRCGQLMTDRQLQKIMAPLPVEQQRQLQQKLQESALLVRVRQDSPVKGQPAQGWQLGRDLQAMSQWQLLACLPWPLPPELADADSADLAAKGAYQGLPESAITQLQQFVSGNRERLAKPAADLFV